MNEIDVSDINPAELLAGLYNRSFVNPDGMGVFQMKPGNMAIEQAQEYLDGKIESDYIGQALERNGNRYFDYLNGRVMRVEINGKTLRTGLYDRDLGQGAAQSVADAIRHPPSRPRRRAITD